jgi:hypothetical protein
MNNHYYFCFLKSIECCLIYKSKYFPICHIASILHLQIQDVLDFYFLFLIIEEACLIS